MRRPSRPLSDRRPRRAQISAEQLGSLSHEFRTPLNGVLGMTRLLDATRLTAEQKSYVAALKESGEHLLTLVNDVLDFARMGGGEVELHPAEVPVEDLLRSCCELLSPRAAEKGVEIAWAAPREVGTIRADEARLRQILLNFAGNAVKFTQSGGVLLRATISAPGRLRFIVEDTGPGVSPSQRDMIFEAFAQADVAHAQLGGAGLGLAIARRLARAMDGEVGVEASRSGGAQFWFEAPFRHARPAIDLPLAGLTVGVASPNPIIREAARRQIQACGGKVVASAALQDVLSRTAPHDVLLVDHTLAGEARSLARPEGRKAIVLLAPEQRDRIGRYRRAGFAGYLIKPLRRDSLAERVGLAAGGAGTIQAQDERAAAAAAPGLRVLLVEDNPINALLARTLLAREGCTVDHAACGAEAVAAAGVGAYDLILMDMRMPGMSGEDTARTLRAQGLTTAIVALTANAFDDDRRACMAAGMDDFLVKPLSPDALREMLTRWGGGTGRMDAGWTGAGRRAKVG